MPHLVISPAIADTIELVDNISEKNTDMGDDSPVKLLMTENGIDLGADATAAAAADLHHKSAVKLKKGSENATELRDLKVDPIMVTTAGICQVLKKFYKGSPTTLGLWDISITGTGKITYPTDLNGKIALVSGIKDKHESFAPGTSPLQAYLTAQGISLATMFTAMQAGASFDEESKKKAALSENEIEQCNLLMAPVNAHVSIIGNYLMEFYGGNPRQLGLWGFVVDESISKPKERTSKVLLGDKITLTGVTIGGALTVVGPGAAHVYKGKTTTGNPVIVPAGAQFGIKKGYSIITVSNPSDLQTLTIKVLCSK